MAELSYADKVFAVLYRMEVGVPLVLAKKVKQENIPLMIEITKMAIDLDFGKQEGWYLEFNNDYTEVRKKRR